MTLTCRTYPELIVLIRRCEHASVHSASNRIFHQRVDTSSFANASVTSVASDPSHRLYDIVPEPQSVRLAWR